MIPFFAFPYTTTHEEEGTVMRRGQTQADGRGGERQT
jgi:hypothetical protein